MNTATLDCGKMVNQITELFKFISSDFLENVNNVISKIEKNEFGTYIGEYNKNDLMF